ncbi:MAG: transposase [Thermoanaerobaculia bacterium]
MERYIGIDVHRDSSTICVVSAAGKRVSQEVLETNGQVVVRYLKQLRGPLHVCIEESSWSEWLHEILSPHVAGLVVYQSQWTPGAKNDAIDAHGLAEKLRLGQVGPGVFKSPNRYRELREWARVYQALTRDVVRAKNRLKSQLQRRGVCCVGASVYDPQQRDSWLRQLPAAMRPTAQLLGLELDGLVDLRAQAEVELLEESHRHRIAKILETAPGIGPIRAALLMATVVTPHRFRSKRQFWSYCGFGVVTRSSADWVQTESGWVKAQSVQTRGLNRNHNPTLKGIFKGAAMTVIHQAQAGHPLKRAYARLLEGGTRPPLARLTIARKIAAAVLAMWKTEEAYRAGS